MSPLRSTRPFFTLDKSSSRRQAHVFFDIMSGNVIAVHGAYDEIAIFDDHFGPAFDQDAEPVRVKCAPREQAMQQNEHESAAEGCEKCGVAVDRAREH